jgi:hypothetical protein
MRTALVTVSVLGLILMAAIAARSDQASAPSRGHADFQGYWMGVDPVPATPCSRSATARIAALPASMTARSSVEL